MLGSVWAWELVVMGVVGVGVGVGVGKCMGVGVDDTVSVGAVGCDLPLRSL